MNEALLCMNIGSPRSPRVKDVRAYLREFLMDHHVIDVPWLVRALIVYGFVLPFRPRKTAAAYQSIWMRDGSPLVVHSKALVQAMSQQLPYPVELALTYGENSVDAALKRLEKSFQDCPDTLYLLPLFPHYAFSTYQAVVDSVTEALKKKKWKTRLVVVPPFFQHPAYVGALVKSLKAMDPQSYDHVVFSYHGLPERHILKSDPTQKHCLQAQDCCDHPGAALATCYRAQVLRTTQAVANELQWKESFFTVAFQSRFGRDRWLEPELTGLLGRLAKSGYKKILIVCPAFVADCIETLEEVGMRAQEHFVRMGGEQLTLVPCLNASEEGVNALMSVVEDCRRAADRIA